MIASSGPGETKVIVLAAIAAAGLVVRIAVGRPPWWMRRRPGAERPVDALRQRQRVLALRMLVGAICPLVLYTLLRSHVGSDAEALGISGAIPAVWVLGMLVWRRRVDWIALAAVILFVLAVALSLVSGGSSLPLKLRGAVVTGVLGLACVMSVLVREPLPLLILQLRARRDPEAARLVQRALSEPVRRRTITVLTMLVGVTLLCAAAVRVILAITLSTGAFLSVSSVTQWAIIAAGGLPTLWYAHRRRRQLRPPPGRQLGCT